MEFPTEDGLVHAVDGITYELQRGRTLGIVGESGSGKTVSALTTMGLTRRAGARISRAHPVRRARSAERCPRRRCAGSAATRSRWSSRTRSPRCTLSTGSAASSSRRCAPTGTSARRRARERAIELLGLVGIPDPARRVDEYPHELSGGMRQRAMIAMALANDPKLLIADEPTTALDVTVQAQILALLERLQSELSMAVVIVTHDLGVVAEMADDIAVMYAGRIVETASAELLFSGPEHPYTWGLLRSIPTLEGARAQELEPIPGSPPSLINRPSGCHFHPRCPYAQPEHARVDPPPAEPVPGEPTHQVACLLEPQLRQRLWAELRSGRTPAEALAERRSAEGVQASSAGASRWSRCATWSSTSRSRAGIVFRRSDRARSGRSTA